MKDFIKWLGVNEKIAKLVVWVFIIMGMLIIFNAALDSLGFPHYQITYDNLKQINTYKTLGILSSWIIVILTFYSITLLVFRIRDFKKITPFAVIYLIINILITRFVNGGVTQLFTILYIPLFCYFFSNRNIKSIIYCILAFIVNSIAQGLTYIYKVKFFDYNKISYIIKTILSIDYFIIMIIIILVKEVYLKKRSEKLCGEAKVGYGSANSKKKETSPKN